MPARLIVVVISLKNIAIVESFKGLGEIAEIDERHLLLGQITGGILDLGRLHAVLADIDLKEVVPLEIRGQFNVARNMALYTYFCYSLAARSRNENILSHGVGVAYATRR